MVLFYFLGSVTNRRFEYREMPISVASRSGHSTSTFKNTAVIVGGRSDKLYEMHKVAHAFSSSSPSTQITSKNPAMAKLPGGRKHHSATVLGNNILVFGGETFDGKSKEPVSEMYLIDSKDSFSWKSLGKAAIGRSGHVAVAFNNGVVIHGGVGERNLVSNLTFHLKVS